MLIQGIQGHVAYPHKAKNAIHHALPFLHALTSYQWDHGNAFFEPSSLQITSLEPFTQSSNVIPGHLRVTFNIRFNTLQTASGIKDTILEMARQHALEASFSWELSGHPFLTQEGQLLDQCQNAIASIGGEKAVLSTGGGTSDARFIAAYGIDVIELGLPNASIHQVNEHVAVLEVKKLATIYKEIIDRLHLEP
jgi:succinyl-diaminopimelate desuccinylase